MDPVVYMNGTFCPEGEAKLSVRSRALNYGLGCFAGIRGYRSDDGRQVNVFRLDKHVRRLEHSARILRLKLNGSPEDVAGVIVELLRRNDIHEDVYVRPLVYANSNELSPILDPDTSATAIFCMPMGRYLSPLPIDVCVSSWRRVRETAIPARAKATAGYLNSALARREALDHGYAEAILLTEEGHVSEGSAEHVFIVRDGCLVSPPSTADNLDGITRQTLVSLASEDLKVPFVERSIGRTELYVSDEVFLCGTGAEITAVRSVDKRVVGDGGIGPITQRLSERFDAVVRGRVPARREWLTPVW
ncbi:MAG: branched-chain amino acid transaminase [Myxococcota bacterium]|nr:branched-chain amino acid transaminase [Myxococcota bacterium]